MSSIASPDLRTMRTPDLYRARAESAAECLLPTVPDANPVIRQLLCASCPLAQVCDAIRERENAAGIYADTEAAAVPAVELAARRPRGIRPAVIWEAA